MAAVVLGCSAAPVVPAIVIERPCLSAAPPARVAWSTVRDGCPKELVCLTRTDENGRLDELVALREWSSEAWRLCRVDDAGGEE